MHWHGDHTSSTGLELQLTGFLAGLLSLHNQAAGAFIRQPAGDYTVSLIQHDKHGACDRRSIDLQCIKHMLNKRYSCKVRLH